jgi:energy-coupling factor transport system substrate-specific component
VSWQAASLALVALAALAGLWWYERRRPSAKLVSLVATLAALAVAARVLFAAVPNVQGTTDVALLSGYVLGPAPGFVVGALAALASNVFLGQGPWTPWQMVGWGMAGIAGAALAAVSRRRAGRLTLAGVCAVAGLAFGAWMDLFTLLAFTAQPSADGYLAIAGISLPFNLAHAIGNAALALAFGPSFVRVLERFRRRLDVRWESSPPRRRAASAGVAAACLATVLGMALAVAGTAAAADDDVSRAVRYLERAQNRDGGFGAAPGQGSSQLITGWTVLGLEAAERHPLDVVNGGRTPIDFIRARSEELNETGELERTVLAVRGAGLDARAFAGRDLVSELLRRRRGDGSFSGLANWTAFGIMALRASGRSARSGAVVKSATWLARQQGSDGGFSLAGGGASFVDETGAALQGLAAAGRVRTRPVRKAVRWLRAVQNPDGGFGQAKGHDSNTHSTAWAVQGIVAARAAPSTFRRASRTPLAYLSSLQQSDGSFRYSRTSAQTPVWVTAQVVAALRRKTFPLRPPARRRVARAAPRSVPPPARQEARGPGRKAADDGRRERVDDPGEAAPAVTRRVDVRPAAGRSPVASRSEGGGLGAEVLVAALVGGSVAAAAGVLVLRRRRVRRP